MGKKIEKVIEAFATGGLSAFVTKEKVNPIEVDYLIPGSDDDKRHYVEDTVVKLAVELRHKYGEGQPYHYLAETALRVAGLLEEEQNMQPILKKED